MKDIKKNGKGDVIRVQVKEFKGATYLDIRTFYENDSGELCPTKKGVSIPIDSAIQVIAAATSEMEGR